MIFFFLPRSSQNVLIVSAKNYSFYFKVDRERVLLLLLHFVLNYDLTFSVSCDSNKYCFVDILSKNIAFFESHGCSNFWLEWLCLLSYSVFCFEPVPRFLFTKFAEKKRTRFFVVQSRSSSTRRCVFLIQAVACDSICRKITGQFPNVGHIKRLHNLWAVNTYTLTGTPCSPDHNSSKQRWRRTARLKKRRAMCVCMCVGGGWNDRKWAAAIVTVQTDCVLYCKWLGTCEQLPVWSADHNTVSSCMCILACRLLLRSRLI